jgi:hypothetical protein
MNPDEQSTAKAILDEIKNQCRQQPDKALLLAQTYESLTRAAKARNEADNTRRP